SAGLLRAIRAPAAKPLEALLLRLVPTSAGALPGARAPLEAGAHLILALLHANHHPFAIDVVGRYRQTPHHHHQEHSATTTGPTSWATGVVEPLAASVPYRAHRRTVAAGTARLTPDGRRAQLGRVCSSAAGSVPQDAGHHGDGAARGPVA